jgi:hypothetical protein
MTDSKKFNKWNVDIKQLQGELSSQKVRDMIIECFYTSQKDYMKSVSKEKGSNVSDKDIHDQIVSIIKSIFKQVGGNFHNPTRADLLRVIGTLRVKAAASGTPKEIVEHHTSQLFEIISML